MGWQNHPNSPLFDGVDGHKYVHGYFTWYFLPYRWIEKGIDGSQTTEVDPAN
jgi:hypothetical protein